MRLLMPIAALASDMIAMDCWNFTPRSAAIDLAPMATLDAFTIPYYSASPDDSAITAWLVAQDLMTCPPNINTPADVDFLDFWHPAKSLSDQAVIFPG